MCMCMYVCVFVCVVMCVVSVCKLDISLGFSKSRRKEATVNNFANILTECFSHHQGESIWWLKCSVETVWCQITLFHLYRSQLRSDHFDFDPELIFTDYM